MTKCEKCIKKSVCRHVDKRAEVARQVSEIQAPSVLKLQVECTEFKDREGR